MTLLEVYVTFGLPLIALGMAAGALWLTKRDRRQLDQEANSPK